MNKKLAALFIMGMVSSVETMAACPSGLDSYTPDSDFVDNGDGTVTHTKTGLMWRQCPYRTNLTEGECVAETNTDGRYATWSKALEVADGLDFAGHTDWRLPNITELSSIVEWRCYNNAINDNMFPATQDFTSGDLFWSSTTLRSSASQARVIDFQIGTESGVGKNNNKQFFVVRDSETEE